MPTAHSTRHTTHATHLSWCKCAFARPVDKLSTARSRPRGVSVIKSARGGSGNWAWRHWSTFHSTSMGSCTAASTALCMRRHVSRSAKRSLIEPARSSPSNLCVCSRARTDVSVCGWECVSVVLSKSREAEAIREGEHESCFFFFAPLFFAFTLPLVLGFGAARVLVLLEERRVTSTHAAHRRHLRCFHHFTSRTSSCTHM
jgi:hypothetical protein